MSYGGNYQQYGGNPYGDAGQAESGYGQSNPYSGQGGYGASNPYGGNDQPLSAPPLQHEESQYSQASQYSQQPQQNYSHGAQPLSQQDFLARIDGTKSRINQLSANITEIANIHQRMLSSPDNRSSAQLESIVSETQIRNTSIKDEIKFLEKDAAREPQNSFKRTQVESLKRTFRSQLEDFQREEADYSKRYRDAIARQYRIVNPEATEQEVQEAANADWGDEGIFQQAGELALLFQQLNEQVVYQEEQVTQIEAQTEDVNKDTTHANQQLDSGIKSARRARKMKWWVFWIVVLIIVILAAVLGGYFGTRNKN
ncbi:hypothetical protein N0V90_001257 [Kalmusia sp. IMI 367209]|nr:hypothetical protein N0V90_001257 [Kalmusia sp. IMI 367209]